MNIEQLTRRFVGKNEQLFASRSWPLGVVCKKWKAFLAARHGHIGKISIDTPFPVVVARQAVATQMKKPELRDDGYCSLINGHWIKADGTRVAHRDGRTCMKREDRVQD